MPSRTVAVAVVQAHCHNLEHEDMAMMADFVTV